MYRQMIPARMLVDGTVWPNDLLRSDRGVSLLDSLYVVQSAITHRDNGLTLDLLAVVEGEVALSIPGVDAVTVVLAAPAPATAPSTARLTQAGHLPPSASPRRAMREEPLSESEPTDVTDPNLGAGWTEIATSFVVENGRWSLALRPVTLELRFADTFLRPIDDSDYVAITLRGDVTLDDAFDITFS